MRTEWLIMFHFFHINMLNHVILIYCLTLSHVSSKIYQMSQKREFLFMRISRSKTLLLRHISFRVFAAAAYVGLLVEKVSLQSKTTSIIGTRMVAHFIRCILTIKDEQINVYFTSHTLYLYCSIAYLEAGVSIN